MDSIVKEGNGFALWSHKFEEVSKGSFLLFVKGLHEWTDGDDGHLAAYK